jgi:cytoskeleton bundling-enhancing protein CbeA-like protein
METTPQTTNELKPEWGLTPSPRAVVAWGARAIYKFGWRTERVRRKVPKSNPPRYRFVEKRTTGADIDLLWDRQSMVGGTDKEREQLKNWLNKKGLKKLKKECEKRYLSTSADETVQVRDGNFMIMANPRASYGYLYIGAWKE